METPNLTPEQRETLIHQIDRRMAKWPDEALMKLEALTRTPDTMQITPTGERQITRVTHPAEPSQASVVQSQWREEPANNQKSKKITRREAVLGGIGGLAALVAVTTGVGWGMSENEMREIRLLVAPSGTGNWGSQIRNELNQFISQLNTLRVACDTTYSQKETHNLVLKNYQSTLSPINQEIANLKSIADQLIEVSKRLDLEAIFEVFANVNIDNLFSLGSVLLKVKEKISDVNLYFQLVTELISTSQKISSQLKEWFSEPSGVNVQLFRPLQENLFHSIDEVRAQASTVQQIWQMGMASELPQVISNLEQISNRAGIRE